MCVRSDGLWFGFCWFLSWSFFFFFFQAEDGIRDYKVTGVQTCALPISRAKVNVLGLISRAEEVGFRGALAAAAGKQLPARSLVISLETSRELPGVNMGEIGRASCRERV